MSKLQMDTYLSLTVCKASLLYQLMKLISVNEIDSEVQL